jgi:hypothetical protein
MVNQYQAKAQSSQKDSTYKKWFIGSSLLMLGNFDTSNNPEYFLLTAGYRITPKDVITVRLERYVYSFPKGIPLGPSLDAPGNNYPGHVSLIAPTIGYQRFWWKGLFTSVHALNGIETFFDDNKKKIGNGFTLYLDAYLGYQFTFFKNRIFFEPSIGISYWPIRTNVPDSFVAVERKWPNYFIQPGLDIGFNF